MRDLPHDHTHHPGPGGPWPGSSEMDPLSAEVLGEFRKAMHLNRQLYVRLASEGGGPQGRTIVLGMLAAHEGITQRDLAEKLHLARPTVTVMLQKMQQGGLIERWADPDDQRLTRIKLTDAGREQAQALGKAYTNLIDSTFGMLSTTDRTEFARLLGLLNGHTAATLKELDA